ncbi:hypothetical protein PpBr36_07495 [Pyricularia pennisetigena]|uniref:hypothetical protein n=1 Tax=Pyricularia pennisetigena TaxID=1578925 RepID=UPI00114F1797|nr:hypothetical protein PpBr36_07495 [Pyricularia pennisetigena]TLS26016.1 hypothetical protein PpBr36_07495 [Pyricularia pennisetigena]
MPSLMSTASLAFALAASVVNAHMEMSFPAPLRSKYNPAAKTVDSDMVSPLSSSGSNFPCKGYLSDLGTPAGKPSATFSPGQKSNMTIMGGAAHNGGSCQASLSYDKGKTFKVIQSWIGECPISGGSSFDFTIPSDAPAGDAVFAWTWNNKVGNPELYMNCAVVTIGGAPKNRVRGMQPRAAVAFAQRPAPFLSNIGNGCKTENMVVDYPNPGPDVIHKGTATKPTCDGGAGQGSGAGAAAPSATSSENPGIPSAAPTSANPGIPTPAPSSARLVSPSTLVTSLIPSSTAPASEATLTSRLDFIPPVIPITNKKPSATPTPSADPTGSLPGGVFITATKPGAAAPTAPAGGANGTAPTGPTGAQPGGAPAPTGSLPSSGGGSTAPVSGQQSGACTDEGAYFCLAGTSFQRCASGSWSSPIPMAPGTSCTPGQSATLFGRSNNKVRRAGARKFTSPVSAA